MLRIKTYKFGRVAENFTATINKYQFRYVLKTNCSWTKWKGSLANNVEQTFNQILGIQKVEKAKMPCPTPPAGEHLKRIPKLNSK